MADTTVHDEHRFVTFTIPASTAVATPVDLPFSAGLRILNALRVLVPRGHTGLTGFALEINSIRVVPWNDPSAWLIADDFHETYPLNLQIDGGVHFKGYNTDLFPHTFYLRAHLTDLPLPTLTVPTTFVVP